LKTRVRKNIEVTMRPRILCFLLAALPGAAAAQTVSQTPVVVDVPPIITDVGETTESVVMVDTTRPFQLFGFRLQTSPTLLRVASWSLGEGLQKHVEENGDPPACDVIVYPDGTGMLAIMALAVPYTSQEYGREWMRVTFEVTATRAKASCLFVQSDTEDYEDDSVSRLSRLISAAERRCIPLQIRAPGVDTPPQPFLRGDVDATGTRELTDAIRLLSQLFLDDDIAACHDASDANDDGAVDIADPIAILGSLFLGAPGPSTECQTDPTADTLPPCLSPSC
jgi:hypothetical protein